MAAQRLLARAINVLPVDEEGKNAVPLLCALVKTENEANNKQPEYNGTKFTAILAWTEARFPQSSERVLRTGNEEGSA